MRVLDQPDVQDADSGQAELAARQSTQLPTPEWVTPATLEFLAWVARRPRSYAETMEAWQTSCPRSSVWEDALGDGLCQLESGRSCIDESGVVLTPRGRAILNGA